MSRHDRLDVKVSKKEKEEVRQLAARRGVSMSLLTRQALAYTIRKDRERDELLHLTYPHGHGS